MLKRNKTFLITTRVDFYEAYGEFRDGVDQELVGFFDKLGFNALLMPNCLRDPLSVVHRLSPDGIILSGGNDIMLKGGTSDGIFAQNGSKERDYTESKLICYAANNDIPLLGICRGMQMINVFFGGALVQNSPSAKKINHVASVHEVSLSGSFILNEYRNSAIKVNSYHKQTVVDSHLGKGLIAMAYARDRAIEALRHRKYNIAGIQWHPERKGGSAAFDRELVLEFFK